MNNALKILTTETQNALFIEQSIYGYFRIKRSDLNKKVAAPGLENRD